MSETYRGKCPLCSGQLVEILREVRHLSDGQIIAKDDLPFLDCENGDYRIDKGSFEAIWEKYNKTIEIDSGRLFVDLLRANQKSHPSKFAPEVWLAGKKTEWHNEWDDVKAKKVV